MSSNDDNNNNNTDNNPPRKLPIPLTPLLSLPPESPLPPHLHNALTSALLSSGAVPRIQAALGEALAASGWTAALRARVHALLRDGECGSVEEVLARVVREAGLDGAAANDQAEGGGNGVVKKEEDEGDEGAQNGDPDGAGAAADLKIPDKAVKEVVRVVRRELENVCEIQVDEHRLLHCRARLSDSSAAYLAQLAAAHNAGNDGFRRAMAASAMAAATATDTDTSPATFPASTATADDAMTDVDIAKDSAGYDADDDTGTSEIEPEELPDTSTSAITAIDEPRDAEARAAFSSHVDRRDYAYLGGHYVADFSDDDYGDPIDPDQILQNVEFAAGEEQRAESGEQEHVDDFKDRYRGVCLTCLEAAEECACEGGPELVDHLEWRVDDEGGMDMDDVDPGEGVKVEENDEMEEEGNVAADSSRETPELADYEAFCDRCLCFLEFCKCGQDVGGEVLEEADPAEPEPESGDEAEPPSCDYCLQPPGVCECGPDVGGEDVELDGPTGCSFRSFCLLCLRAPTDCDCGEGDETEEDSSSDDSSDDSDRLATAVAADYASSESALVNEELFCGDCLRAHELCVCRSPVRYNVDEATGDPAALEDIVCGNCWVDRELCDCPVGARRRAALALIEGEGTAGEEESAAEGDEEESVAADEDHAQEETEREAPPPLDYAMCTECGCFGFGCVCHGTPDLAASPPQSAADSEAADDDDDGDDDSDDDSDDDDGDDDKENAAPASPASPSSPVQSDSGDSGDVCHRCWNVVHFCRCGQQGPGGQGGQIAGAAAADGEPEEGEEVLLDLDDDDIDDLPDEEEPPDPAQLTRGRKRSRDDDRAGDLLQMGKNRGMPKPRR
ncbi:hypothetical protein BDY21DRAFT_401635 [Lineolata rhizophorae]|uniref:Uncharacterized protein n=1 Tax=Lineolata rhizophorae TaxID=578093 RepID=A0A6A6NPI0_9PEZI|nr:hypothetical protein BDY21DRAFT_401635 [Lineolata rhizophorae]